MSSEPAAIATERQDWIAAGIIVAILTIVLWPVISGAACYFARDLTAYYFPAKKMLHDTVARGEFPSWDPTVSAGQPAAANPEYEVFYPGQWPIFLRDYFLGYRLHIVFHFYVAALGMYAFLRSLRASVWASLAAAFTFALTGPFLSSVNLLPILFTLAWLPFVFLFGRRAIRDASRRDAAVASIFFGLQALVLEPATLMIVALFVAAYALHRSLVEKGIRPIAFGASIGVGGLLVAAVQVLPTIDHLRQSVRSRGFTLDLIGSWSMPPSKILELVQPHWMGHDPFSGGPYWGGAAYSDTGGPFFSNLYLGLTVVVFVIAGLTMRSRVAIVAVAASALAWIVALGRHTPLLSVLAYVHVPIPLRFPEKFAIVPSIILTIAAALLLDKILDDGKWQKRTAIVASVVAGILGMGWLLVHSSAFAGFFLKNWQLQPVDLPLMDLVRSDWSAMLLRAVILAAIFTISPRLPRRYFRAALIVFVLGDALPLMREFSPTLPSEFFTKPATADELKRPSDGYRVFVEPEWSSGPVSRRYFADPTLYPWRYRNAMFGRVPVAWGYRTVLGHDIDLTNLMPATDFVDAMWDVRRAGRRDWAEIFMAMSNAGYRAAFRPYEQELSRHADPRDVQPTIFVPAGDNPRYYFADEIVKAPTPRAFVDRVTREQHSRRVAYVGFEPFAPAPGSVVTAEERTSRIELKVRSAGRGFLVATNTPQKWWSATIDGVPANIDTVNVGYQGVVVPPGEHTIVFRYFNPLIAAGGVVSLIALLAACAVILTNRTPERNAPNAASAL